MRCADCRFFGSACLQEAPPDILPDERPRQEAANSTQDACAPQRLPAAYSFRHRDCAANTAPFNVAIVHRLGEHRRDDELATVARFDLVIDLELVCRRGHEEYHAILADIDIIDAMDCRRAGAGRRIDSLKSAWQKIDDRDIGDWLPLQTADVQSHMDRLAKMRACERFIVFARKFAINLQAIGEHVGWRVAVEARFNDLEKRAWASQFPVARESQRSGIARKFRAQERLYST